MYNPLGTPGHIGKCDSRGQSFFALNYLNKSKIDIQFHTLKKMKPHPQPQRQVIV